MVLLCLPPEPKSAQITVTASPEMCGRNTLLNVKAALGALTSCEVHSCKHAEMQPFPYVAVMLLK